MKKFLVFFAALCAVCSSLSAQVFYEGQGGKNLGGIRVSEIVPRGLSSDNEELIPLIQDILRGDFKNFANMTVPALGDTALSTKYTLTGAITKNAGNYFLSFIITDNESGTQKTSYGPIQCTEEELRTLKGIKAASEKLIEGMGITLTQAGKNALRTIATNEAEAKNLIAKGVVKDRNGDPIGAQMLFYQAIEIDPSQMEAANRASITAVNISTGNTGDDTRNDIQWRKNWITTLTDTEGYFDNFFKTFNQPYALVYTPELQYGKIDYGTETRPVSFTVELRERSSWTDPILKTVQNVQRELNNTGRKKEWGLNWPRSRVSNVAPLSSGYKRLEVVVELVNTQNKVIGQQTFIVRGDWNFSFDYNTGDLKSITTSTSPSKERPSRITFDRVSANDITGNLTLRFVSVNNVPVDQASRTGLLMIAPRSGYYDVAGFNDDGYDRDGYGRDGFNRAGYGRDGYGRDGFDKDGYGRDGFNRAGYGRDGYGRDGFDKDGYGRDGYDRDGFDRNGINRAGKDKKGYLVDNSNRTGYDREGYNTAGYDRGGYGRDGFDRNGINRAGKDKKGYLVDNSNRTGYDREGYNTAGYDRGGYGRDGYNEAGYDKAGYDRTGFNIDGRNKWGQTRRQAERAAREARRQIRWQEWIDSRYAGHFGGFMGGGGTIQPSGGFFEFGFEVSGKWLIADCGLGLGGVSLDNKMVEKEFDITELHDPFVLNPRLGVAFPLSFWFNIGGGIEFLCISVKGKKDKGRDESKYLDTLITPYLGARLNIPLGQLMGFIGYRAEFMPADKVETYFGNQSFLRHTIFAGFEILWVEW